jgi:hypothetical protein
VHQAILKQTKGYGSNEPFRRARFLSATLVDCGTTVIVFDGYQGPLTRKKSKTPAPGAGRRQPPRLPIGRQLRRTMGDARLHRASSPGL